MSKDSTNVSETWLHCMDCGCRYTDFPLDTTLPNKQWRMIHPEDGGVLCANCIVVRASKLPGVIALRAHIEFADDEPAPLFFTKLRRLMDLWGRLRGKPMLVLACLIATTGCAYWNLLWDPDGSKNNPMTKYPPDPMRPWTANSNAANVLQGKDNP